MSRGPHGTFLLKNFGASSVPLVTRDEHVVAPEVMQLGSPAGRGMELSLQDSC